MKIESKLRDELGARFDTPDHDERCNLCGKVYDASDLLVVETPDPSWGSCCLTCAIKVWGS